MQRALFTFFIDPCENIEIVLFNSVRTLIYSPVDRTTMIQFLFVSSINLSITNFGNIINGVGGGGGKDYLAWTLREVDEAPVSTPRTSTGSGGGVIVHDDVQMCQWLRTPNGRLKLGDFNRARIMSWDLLKGEYCKFNNGEAFSQYRAPEEFAARNLDEKIDQLSDCD
jgi:hypothetical protein